MADIAAPTTTETPAGTPAAAPAPAAAGEDLSVDQLLAAAIEANPDAIVETPDAPVGETAPAGDPPSTQVPIADANAPAPAEPEPDVSVVRARAMLAAAKETERAAQATVAGYRAEAATRLKTAPKAFLAEHGLTIDEIIDASIAEGAVAAPAAADPVAELRARMDAREAAEDQRRVDEAITRTKDAVKTDARFPTVNAKGHQQLVVDFMIEYHAQHGKAIPWDKAAALIEADLAPPAPAPKPAANVAVPTPTPRPGTQTLTARDSTNYVPPAGELPEDPDKLLKLLVSQLPD